MMREWWGRAHNRLSAFETQQFELVWICLTSVPCSRHLPKSNSFDTNIIFTSLLLSLLAFQKQHGWGHQLLKWVHTHWIQSPHSMPGVMLLGGRALLFAVFLQLSIFVLSRGIEGGQLLVDQSEWPLKALASLPPLPPLLLQLTHYYHHCLLNINACKERLWPEKWMNFRKKERGGGVTPIRKNLLQISVSPEKNAILLTLFPFFAFPIAMHWSTSQSGHWAGSCFHPES